MILRFALDSNCMIAAVCSWHVHHERASAEIERRLDAGERLVIPAPALAESYSVLTRLPPPYRLSTTDGWGLLQQSFVRQGRVVVLPAERYVRSLQRFAGQEVAGGRIYDMLIAECAREANAAVLLTFNRRDFEPLPQDLTIMEPE